MVRRRDRKGPVPGGARPAPPLPPDPRVPCEADARRSAPLFERVVSVAVQALGHGTPPGEVFFALQRAAAVVPLAEGAPPEVVARLARDVAQAAADSELCQQIALDLATWLDGRRRAH